MSVLITNQIYLVEWRGILFWGHGLTTYSAMKLPEREYPESKISWQSCISSFAELILWVCEPMVKRRWIGRITTREKSVSLIDPLSRLARLRLKKVVEDSKQFRSTTNVYLTMRTSVLYI